MYNQIFTNIIRIPKKKTNSFIENSDNMTFIWDSLLGLDPDGNKILFANKNKLLETSWPPPVAKLLGCHSLANNTRKEHK
jgi:hypothetical protein